LPHANRYLSLKYDCQSVALLRKRSEEVVQLDREIKALNVDIQSLTDDLNYSGSSKTVEEIQNALDICQTKEYAVGMRD
jgi:phosphoribosyl-dephospho-CoA transferase